MACSGNVIRRNYSVIKKRTPKIYDDLPYWWNEPDFTSGYPAVCLYVIDGRNVCLSYREGRQDPKALHRGLQIAF